MTGPPSISAAHHQSNAPTLVLNLCPERLSEYSAFCPCLRSKLCREASFVADRSANARGHVSKRPSFRNVTDHGPHGLVLQPRATTTGDTTTGSGREFGWLRPTAAPALCCAVFHFSASLVLTGSWFVLLSVSDFYSIRKGVEDATVQVQEILASSGMAQQQATLADLEQQAASSSLWDDPARAQQVLSALGEVKDDLATLKAFQNKVWVFFSS